MSGGSMHDFLHKQKRVLTLPSLVRVAIDVSEGMNYLHQNNIIHRDLKAANLLTDGNGVRDLHFYVCFLNLLPFVFRDIAAYWSSASEPS